jgi:hypothetical protein
MNIWSYLILWSLAFPQETITNGLIRATLYLPDASEGYYRGTRFDWSGVMPDLEFGGHSYCSQWFETYSPTIHDAIMGPVESFEPLGYGNGSRFVMIGVGILSRPDDKPYNPFRYYTILDGGQWMIRKKKDRITFTHILRNAYHYEKTISLVKGRPELRISHHLLNTGTVTIVTQVYDHNLFVLDHRPPGPGFTLRFPFSISGATQTRGIGSIASIQDSTLRFLRTPQGKEQVYAVLEGFDSTANDYDILMESGGAGVRITADRPLSKLVVWGSATIATPEPYISLNIPPGGTATWTIVYHFYSTK